MTKAKEITINNSGQLKNYLILIIGIVVFLISIHHYFLCFFFLIIFLTLYSYLCKDITFTTDEIIINRKYFLNQTNKFDYSILKKVSIIGGMYSLRMPTTLKLTFKNISSIEYFFPNQIEKEKILSFFIERNISIQDNNIDGVKEMIAKIKAKKN